MPVPPVGPRRVLRVPDGDVTGRVICTELIAANPWRGLPAFARSAAAAGAGVRVLGSSAPAVAQQTGAAVLDRAGRSGGVPADGLLVAFPGAADQVLGWWRAVTS